MKYLLAACAIGFTSFASANVYTCNVNGKTAYQGKPCAGSAEQNQKINQARQSIEKTEIARANYNARESSRIKPRIGMTAKEAEQSTWGYPNKVNTTTYASGTDEQWVYRSGSSSKYLYFTNGRLTSIQEYK